MAKLAQYFAEELCVPKHDVELENLTKSLDRYVIYKVGPILTASVSTRYDWPRYSMWAELKYTPIVARSRRAFHVGSTE